MKNKSVIKKQSHYSIVIMRDDSNVHSFRMRSAILRTLVFIYFLLMVVGGLSLGAGIHYWKSYSSMLPQFKENEAELSEMQHELAELRNFKTVVMAHNKDAVPVAMNNEVGVDIPAEAVPTPTANVASGTETGGDAPVLGLPAGNQDVVPPNARQEQTSSAAAPESSDSGQEILPRVSAEASPVRINDFVAQPYGQDSIRIRYLLTVAKFVDSGQAWDQVSGTASYVGVLKDGRRMDLNLQVQSNAKFSISRMKTMTAVGRLPEGCSTDDLQQVDVYVEIAGGAVFYDTYTFPQ